MKKIYCYFLGAGASCNALPIVKNVPERLEFFVKHLDMWFKKTEANSKDLSEAAKWLLENMKRHYTIDTFAKKLFLSNSYEDLKKLKAVISCFFVYEQTQRNVDYRYDSFFASILQKRDDGSISLPDNIRILTWNYDTQLEKAFYEFCGDERVVIEQITFNEKQIFRLNGICGTNPPGHLSKAYKATVKGSGYDGLDAAIELFKGYYKNKDSADPDIKFAWENNGYKSKLIQKSLFEETNILVIIGYSFPFFNRDVDKYILHNFSNLERIYVQVPKFDHQAIKERLEALKPNLPELILLEDTSLFYIPFDYS